MARTIDLGKVVGERGPQGPQGERGPQGEQGPQGPEPTNVVHRTGNETIEGRKEFTGEVASSGQRVVGTAFAAVGMPSGSAITYTGEGWEDGHEFTAPCNGWLSLGKLSSEQNQYLQIAIGTLAHVVRSTAANQPIFAYLPMTKGQCAVINFSAGGNWSRISFIKAVAEV